ncbi:MAG: hypothetical protein EBU36_05965 [Verrucomicrobia bacterium]|nr:hypothetical protein [Verrucomicrobiota bacterium]
MEKDSNPVIPNSPGDFLHFEPAQLLEGGALDEKWFCLRVAPKQEHLAIAHLRKIFKIEVFCPRLRFQKATRTGRRWYVEALFPSYLFGRFDYLTQHRGVQYPEVKMGEEVQVVEGAFAGLKAVVTRIMPARQRVAVLLEFLGRLSETEVPVATVLPTARHPLEGVPEEARKNRK